MMKKILFGIVVISTLLLGGVTTVSAQSWLWPIPTSATFSKTLSRGWWYNSSSDYHAGVDIAVRTGTAVMASKDGTVWKAYRGCGNYSCNAGSCSSNTCSGNALSTKSSSGYCGESYGNSVFIKHSDGTISIYGHLSEVLVNAGDSVTRGQMIGKSGSSGYSTGPHLHFTITTKTSGYSKNSINNNPLNSGMSIGNSKTDMAGATITYAMKETADSTATETPAYPDKPIKYVVCSTSDASDITATSAKFNGTFTNPAGARIVKRGYQWGTTPEMCNLTMFDCDITWADGLSHNMKGLSPNTTYYFKLIIQDENGKYIYGNTKSVTTLSSGIEKVRCNTGDAYNITATSAAFNGTFTNPSGARIVKRGFQWGTTPEMCNFTVFDCDITWADGLNHNMTNLEPNTTYYYKLIVKGENGDYVYGNQKTFTTLPAPDTEKPIITNLKARYISEKSFTIQCNLYDNADVTRVWMVIYSPNGEHQFGASASNGAFSYTVNTSDYGGAGYYSVHIYAFDANSNSSGKYSTGKFLVADDTVAPTLTDLTVSNVGNKVFEVNCNLWDNVDVTRLWIVIYCPKGEFQFAIPAKQGTFTYPIDTELYGGLGKYSIHLYAFDDAENSSGMVSTGSIIPQYYIGYDANGGDGAPGVQVKKYGERLILDSTQPIRAGYIFKGWSKNSASTEVDYYPGDAFEGNNDLMLYACWEPMSFKITFNANLAGFSESVKTVWYNSNYGDIPVLSKEGYAFLGWFTDPLYGSLVTANTTVSILENQTLYAHWELLEPFVESVVMVKGDVHTINSEVYHVDSGVLVVAGYKSGQMVDKTYVPYSKDMPDAELTGDIDEIRVMVWDALGSFKPVCEMEIIPESEFATE
ncbi:MAG: InlB B-repeat-containing protein [Clostridia bacterium]|nr:InlB B-repeat-containing protein [Clostridia bacterium]